MAKDWYYAFEGNSVGPISAEEFDALVEAGTIRSDTLVWQEGMDDWLPLGRSGAAPVSEALPPRTDGHTPEDPSRADAHTFPGALKDGFARYVDFRTRSSRPQFWWWVLWMFILSSLASLVDVTLGMSEAQPFSALFSLGVLIPNLAVGARRLHDTGRTAWWLLLCLVPLIGTVILIVFFCLRSEDGPNRWGPRPGR